jgi:hypothetical protein
MADVGQVTTVTPSVFAAELDRVRAVVDMVARDVSTQTERLTAEQRAAWTDFVMRWGAFYNEHSSSSWTSSFTSGPYELIGSFEREALAWRATIERAGGRVTVPLPPPPPTSSSAPPRPLLADVSPFMWGLLAVGGVFAVGYAASSLGIRVGRS